MSLSKNSFKKYAAGTSRFNRIIMCVTMMCVTAAAMDINDVDEDQFEDVDDE